MSVKNRNRRLALGLAVAGVGAVVAGLAACQTYDFEPVQPLAIAQKTQTKTITARNLKPDVMLLVDSSGSMVGPTDPSDPACQLSDGGICGPPPNAPCPASCPTRWTDLEAAMNQFLTNYGTVARLGLTFFPDTSNTSSGLGICGPADRVAVPMDSSNDDPTSLQNTANAINAEIGGHSPAGGTPTSLSLQYVDQQYSTLDTTGRQNFVLLLTDGLPNCNPDNPNDYNVDAGSCRCTESPSVCSSPSLERLACLDEAASVTEVQNLAAKNIKTIVVGFGADTASGDGPEVLSQMANAGGFARSCPNGTNDECGTQLPDGGWTDTCNTGTLVCNTPYYQASTGSELADALGKIGASFQGDPCVFVLDSAPSDPSLLSVLVNGQEIAPGTDTWSYQVDSTSGNPEVVFTGSTCTQIESSTPSDPVTVEIRVVQGL